MGDVSAEVILLFIVPTFNLLSAAAGIFVNGNVVTLNQLRVIVLYKQIGVFCAVLAAFCAVVAQSAHVF